MIQPLTLRPVISLFIRCLFALIVIFTFVGCGSDENAKSQDEIEKIDYSPVVFSTDVIINSPVSRTGEPINIQIAIAKGKAPYKVAVDFDDETDNAELIASEDGFLNVAHKYSSEGDYDIRFTVTDANGEVVAVNKKVAIQNSTQATHWSLDVKSSVNNYVKTNVSFNTEQVANSESEKSAYKLDKRVTPEEDPNYSSFFSLPIPQNIISLAKNVRITFSFTPVYPSDSQFSFGFVSDKNQKVNVDAFLGKEKVLGKVIKDDLLSNKREIAIFEKSLSGNSSPKFIVEIKNNSTLSFYQYLQDNQPILLHQSNIQVLDQYVTEFLLQLEENGRIDSVTLEYDANRNGEYETNELVILNTPNKSVEWNDIDWVAPVSVANNPLNYYREGLSVLSLLQSDLIISCNINDSTGETDYSSCSASSFALNMQKRVYSIDDSGLFDNKESGVYLSEKSNFVTEDDKDEPSSTPSPFLSLGISKKGELIQLDFNNITSSMRRGNGEGLISQDFYGLRNGKKEVFTSNTFLLLEQDYSNKPTSLIFNSLDIKIDDSRKNEPNIVASSFEAASTWFSGLTNELVPDGGKAYSVKFIDVPEKAYAVIKYVANADQTGKANSLSELENEFRGVVVSDGELFAENFKLLKFRINKESKQIEWGISPAPSPTKIPDPNVSDYTVVQIGNTKLYQSNAFSGIFFNRDTFLVELEDENNQTVVCLGLSISQDENPTAGISFNHLNKIAFEHILDVLRNADSDHQVPAKVRASAF